MALAVSREAVHAGILMSMYTDILETAQRQRQRPSSSPTVSDAMTELLDCQGRLGSANALERSTDWTATALANQVAYDVALIELARSIGLTCDPRAFERPELCRTELIRELLARGLRLDDSATTAETGR